MPSGSPAPTAAIESWGRIPTVRQVPTGLEWRDQVFPAIPPELSVLPHGLGRSYGDSCLNDGNALLLTRRLDRFISFDRVTGLLRCEAGVTLAEILRLVVPQGWFLPVTPGTKFVTVGGAIANDVHGKNHHWAGTFGRHVTAFELIRSDGTRRVCTPAQHPEWYGATIGGLGLTGLITWAEVQLRPIANPFIECETVKFGNLGEFFTLDEDSAADFECTMSWVDCTSRGRSLGRGHYMRGNHASPQLTSSPTLKFGRSLPVPFDAPAFALSTPVVKAFNFAYYHRQLRRAKRSVMRFDPFFYPLDMMHNWNRIYGRRGFFQYQFVVPHGESRAAVKEIFEIIAASGQASFLAVLKTFGAVQSPGLLSFPRPGVTLALDFPNRGEKTLALFAQLDRIVESVDGAVYPAKDARMSGESFRKFFPRWQQLALYVDPRFSSSFWRRVTAPASERT